MSLVVRSSTLLMALAIVGCVDPLEPPGGSGDPLTCTFEGNSEFFTITGSAGGTNVTISDLDPPHATVKGKPESLQLNLDNQTEQAAYNFRIKGYQAGKTGILPVLLEESPEGIAMGLTFQRPGLGRIDVESTSGIINFVEATDSVIAASFKAALGSADNRFSGCFRFELEVGP